MFALNQLSIRNAEMMRRVDRWLAGGEPARMPLHVVYLTCSDQSSFADHVTRINRVMTEIQNWYAVQHEALGEHAFRLVLFHVNGRWTQITTAMTVDKAGQIDLTQANRRFSKAMIRHCGPILDSTAVAAYNHNNKRRRTRYCPTRPFKCHTSCSRLNDQCLSLTTSGPNP